MFCTLNNTGCLCLKFIRCCFCSFCVFTLFEASIWCSYLSFFTYCLSLRVWAALYERFCLLCLFSMAAFDCVKLHWNLFCGGFLVLISCDLQLECVMASFYLNLVVIKWVLWSLLWCQHLLCGWVHQLCNFVWRALALKVLQHGCMWLHQVAWKSKLRRYLGLICMMQLHCVYFNTCSEICGLSWVCVVYWMSWSLFWWLHCNM